MIFLPPGFRRAATPYFAAAVAVAARATRYAIMILLSYDAAAPRYDKDAIIIDMILYKICALSLLYTLFAAMPPARLFFFLFMRFAQEAQRAAPPHAAFYCFSYFSLSFSWYCRCARALRRLLLASHAARELDEVNRYCKRDIFLFIATPIRLIFRAFFAVCVLRRGALYYISSRYSPRRLSFSFSFLRCLMRSREIKREAARVLRQDDMMICPKISFIFMRGASALLSARYYYYFPSRAGILDIDAPSLLFMRRLRASVFAAFRREDMSIIIFGKIWDIFLFHIMRRFRSRAAFPSGLRRGGAAPPSFSWYCARDILFCAKRLAYIDISFSLKEKERIAAEMPYL